MHQRIKRISIILIGLFLLQIACQTLTGSRPTSPVASTPLAVPLSTALPATSGIPGAKRADAAGPACFGSFGYGVTCIENNEWVNYSRKNGALSGDLIKDIAVCPGGEILVLHALGLNLFNGTIWRRYEQGWGYGSSEAVACDTHGGFWVAHYEGVSHFDGLHWQTYTVKETLSSDPEAYGLVNDVAVAPDGVIWVVTVNSIAMFANETWTVYEEGAGFDDKYFFENIAFDSQGHPWITASLGLFTYDGLFWNFYPSQDISTPQSIVVDSQDRVWVGTLSRGLLVYENGSWLTFTPQNSPLASYNIIALAVDTAGRIWVGTAWGLHVIAGEKWTSYQMSNSDLVDDNIAVIAVAGTGPALPSVQEKAPGAITGRITDADGAPLADATLKVCVETIYSSYRGATPCEGHPYTRDAVSDADGVFTIDNLPNGFYNLAIQTGETWMLYTTRSRSSSERFLVPAGETINLGEITVGEE